MHTRVLDFLQYLCNILGVAERFLPVVEIFSTGIQTREEGTVIKKKEKNMRLQCALIVTDILAGRTRHGDQLPLKR